MDFLPTLLPTRQVDTPPTRKLNRRAADILILFNVFNRNFVPPGCGLVLIFDLREVKWCGFSSCLERVGADFWSAWCGLVRTGADFCYWLVRLVDSRATLCSLDLTRHWFLNYITYESIKYSMTVTYEIRRK